MFGNEYQKIQSIWKRTTRGVMLPWEWSRPEFGLLAGISWNLVEKVDGTNVRLHVTEDGSIAYGGRTDRAQMPPRLLDALQGLPMTGLEDVMARAGAPMTIYGEGYGSKIQGGGNYRPDNGFVAFDIEIGGQMLERDAMQALATSLGLDVAPLFAVGTLHDAIDIVSSEDGHRSAWGDFRAEGFVCTPVVPLYNRFRERVIVKVKSVDFDKLRKEGVSW